MLDVRMCNYIAVHYFSVGNPDYVFLTPVFSVGELGNGGIISVLFESPSGFAIFKFDGVQLFLSNAMEVQYLSKLVLKYGLACSVVPFALIDLIFLDLLRLLQKIWANYVYFELAEEVNTYTFISL
jgi:hypothetical protein